jgi:iron(III) transport system substrate-binding protein
MYTSRTRRRSSELPEDDKAKVNRRKFLKYAGGAIGVAAVAAAGYGLYQTTAPQPTTTTATSAISSTSAITSNTGPYTPPQTLIDAAKKEGSVLLYESTFLDRVLPFLAIFTGKYGVKVDVYRATSATLITKWQNELTAGQYLCDVIDFSDEAIWRDVSSKGYLLKYDSPVYNEILSWAQGWPSGAHYFAWRDVYSVGIGYNTKYVKPADAPKSWKDFLDPKWDKKIVFNDVRIGGISYSDYYTVRDTVGYGVDFWQKMALNHPFLSDSHTTMSAKIGSGEYLVGPFWPLSEWYSYNQQSAPVAWAVPQEGLASFAIGMGIPAKAPHPNAAKLLFDYWMSFEGQNAWQAIQGTPSGRMDLFSNPIVPEINKQIPPNVKAILPDITDLGAKRTQYIAEFSSIFGL